MATKLVETERFNEGLARLDAELMAARALLEAQSALAGSRVVYQSSSLQRRVRDLRVAAQHVAVHPRHYVAAGAAVLARLS